MAKQSIQGFVELASGLGELTKSRALEAANELLALTGLEGSSKKMGQQAAAFADEMMSAAESNRKQLVELVRTEIDAALGRVDLGRLAADVNAVTAAVTALAGQLEEVATMVAVRAGLTTTEVAEPYVEPAPAQPSRVAAAGPAKKAPAKKAPAKKAPAKKATAKKATAKKALAKKALGEEGAGEEGAREEGAGEEGAGEEGAGEEGAGEEGAGRWVTSPRRTGWTRPPRTPRTRRGRSLHRPTPPRCRTRRHPPTRSGPARRPRPATSSSTRRCATWPRLHRVTSTR